MRTVRHRLDIVQAISATDMEPFGKAEICAFHGRKIVEGIALGCLVALENGVKKIPRDLRGQWNAESILRRLQAKNLQVFPSPSQIRQPTDAEKAAHGVKATVEGIPDRRMTPSQLVESYRKMHRWLHEINPYVDESRGAFMQKYLSQLYDDLGGIEALVERHTISIGGETFLCVLRDRADGGTKVLPLSKVASLFQA